MQWHSLDYLAVSTHYSADDALADASVYAQEFLCRAISRGLYGDGHSRHNLLRALRGEMERYGFTVNDASWETDVMTGQEHLSLSMGATPQRAREMRWLGSPHFWTHQPAFYDAQDIVREAFVREFERAARWPLADNPWDNKGPFGTGW